MVSGRNRNWSPPMAGFTSRPRLAPDGMTLTFEGSNSRIWQMQTDTPPTPLPLPTSTTATITPDGGELVSEIDQTHYDFAPGKITATVQFTHVMWSNLPPPPPNHVTIDGSSSGLKSRLRSHGDAVAWRSAPHRRRDGLPSPSTTTTTNPASSFLARAWRLAEAGWVQLPGVDNPELATLTTLVDHFSYFAVFGETRPRSTCRRWSKSRTSAIADDVNRGIAFSKAQAICASSAD